MLTGGEAGLRGQVAQRGSGSIFSVHDGDIPWGNVPLRVRAAPGYKYRVARRVVVLGRFAFHAVHRSFVPCFPTCLIIPAKKQKHFSSLEKLFVV